jgi:phosphate transport system substrate-binding protein
LRKRGRMCRVLLAIAILVSLATSDFFAQSSYQPDKNAKPYAGEFDLSELPVYSAENKVSGTIRNFGSGLGGLLQLWEDGFRKIHPDVKFEDKLPTSDAAIGALVSGVADLGPAGREPVLTETLSFYETYGYHVTGITVASGTYDNDGKSPGLVIVVHKDNPLAKLTMKQLDGIFGAERTGGFRGFKWTLKDGRPATENIRTWGQLGLKGEWANKQINTYGHAPSGTSMFFTLKVLKNSDKWNPNYREFVETGSKMIADDDHTSEGGLQNMISNLLAKDRYGIAWTIIPQARHEKNIKYVALADGDGQNYIEPTKASFQNRTYPLTRSIYIYLNRKPGTPIDPKTKEFLRYVLSREGQEIVARHGGYLPLPSETVKEQFKLLD